MGDYINLLGCRGSIPVSGPKYRKYGGATTSFLFSFAGEIIAVDAGTGLLNYPAELMNAERVTLILTHPHIDHLLGFPLWPYAMKKGAEIDIYSKVRDERDCHDQLALVMKQPLWPVGPRDLPADFRFMELPDELHVGEVEIDALEGPHPGGVSILKLSAKGKSAVVATDFTLNDEFEPVLSDFARDCDILLCDGQYNDDEWPARKTFGHNTWNMAARLAKDCGAKRLLVVHHDCLRTDEELDAAACEVKNICSNASFAKDGELIEL